MRLIIRFLVCLFIIVLFESIISSSAQGETILSEKDANSTVVLKVGEIFQVVLPGNPTTGYNWEMVSGNIAILRQIGEREFKRDSELIGSGGKFVFTFEAASPGQAIIRLIYHRPWERNIPPANTFEITTIIK